MITFPRTGGKRRPHLVADTGDGSCFDQSSRRSSSGLLHRHELDEDRCFILPCVYHLLDASRLPFDPAQTLAQFAPFLLIHVLVSSRFEFWHSPRERLRHDTPRGIYAISNIYPQGYRSQQASIFLRGCGSGDGHAPDQVMRRPSKYSVIQIFAIAGLQRFCFDKLKCPPSVGLPFSTQEHGVFHVSVVKTMREFV